MKVVVPRQCMDYESAGHPESPERIRRILNEFKREGGYDFIEPNPCSEQDLLLVHTQEHIDRVRNNEFSDADTPNIPDIYRYASLAVGSAITASQLAERGEHAFSFARPPGHPAG